MVSDRSNGMDAPRKLRILRPGTIVAVAALLAGCATERLYEGPPLAPEDRAVVRADPVVSAGLPVQIQLRRVNQREVRLSANRVELPPGKHQLLVDCRVAESGSVRRFTVEAELEAGGRYRLVADATARNCEAVALVGD
jgi:acyl-coenzyme A thioesterase PaaI-like protein